MGGNVLTWVIYDVSDNLLRTKISEKCKDYGLKRLQKSAFFGELDKNTAEMLAVDIENILQSERATGDDCVFILPECKECISKKITIGKGFDENEFKDKYYVIFR
jgi:CRISPR-associated protein Cas2